MSDILTITFNPAIDKSFNVQALLCGRKLACTKPRFEAGGGGINVARAIKQLGGDVTAVFLGGGANGEELSRLLEVKNVPAWRIAIPGATRENIIINTCADGKQYLFDLPGPKISRSDWKRCLEAVRQTTCRFIVVSGSLPPGVPLTVYRELAAIARKKNAKLLVDAAGPALQAALQAGVFLVKPNLREITAIAGMEATETNAIAAAQQYVQDGRCDYMLVSLGKSGALLVQTGGAVRIHPPHMHAKGSVGAGDSLLAGLVLALSKKKTIREAATYGVACGTAATLNEGTAIFRKADVNRFYKLMKAKN